MRVNCNNPPPSPTSRAIYYYTIFDTINNEYCWKFIANLRILFFSRNNKTV